jgi:hypothetical protein
MSVHEPALRVLRERIEQLDAEASQTGDTDVDELTRQLVQVMGFYTDTEMAAEAGDLATLAPSEADELTGACRLLRHLGREAPALVSGPLDTARQLWIGTAPPTPSPEDPPAPSRERFIQAQDASAVPASTKPSSLGLYTSTATRSGLSMWRAHLDLYYGSDLYPLPWYTWEVRASAESSILEIASAREWAEFVGEYARDEGGLLYPDWRAVAGDFDAVHVTARAVVAMQGFNLPTARGTTAATYWDLESTLWLRWRFDSVRLRDVTR